MPRFKIHTFIFDLCVKYIINKDGWQVKTRIELRNSNDSFPTHVIGFWYQNTGLTPVLNQHLETSFVFTLGRYILFFECF